MKTALRDGANTLRGGYWAGYHRIGPPPQPL